MTISNPDTTITVLPGKPGRQANKTSVRKLLGLAARHQDLMVFLVTGLIGIFLADWMAYGIRLGFGDALSRTLSSMQIIYSREPRLAELGFIWPPLPGIAQLPFMVFGPRVAFYGFSGNIVSALSAALLLSSLNSLLRWARVEARWRIPILLLFALNPMWLCYALNGMSEMPFLLFFTLTTRAFLGWKTEAHWRFIITGGMATALMFGCRYDALPYGAVFALSIGLIYLFNKKEELRSQVVGVILAYLVPVVYAAALWIFFNWLIMGNPLFFLGKDNVYSNAFLTRTVNSSAEIQDIKNSWTVAMNYLLVNLFAFSPLFLLLTVVATVKGFIKRDAGYIGLVLLLMIVPVFQFISYRSGQTFGFWRFYISALPGALLLAAPLLREAKGWVRTGLLAVVLLGLAGGLWSTTSGLLNYRQPDSAYSQLIVVDEEVSFLKALANPSMVVDNYQEERQVAETLYRRFGNQQVLIMGDIQLDNVILFSNMSNRFINPSDPMFDQALGDPARYADYVLVAPRDANDSRFYAVLEMYPDFYKSGAPNFVLDSEIGSFRLYRSLLR